MAIPEKPALYYEKSLLDRVIDNVLGEDSPLSQAELNRVSVAAQVQAGIDHYRRQAQNMSEDQLRSEEHNSALLGHHLQGGGKTRPARCHAHAIVAGKHKYAAQLRIIMAVLKIRIDDADNGCWLPESTAATPHPSFPAAPPHSRIHRYNYFFWLFFRLRGIRQEQSFRQSLQLIAKLLQQGKAPEYVMLPKGVGLPTGSRLI